MKKLNNLKKAVVILGILFGINSMFMPVGKVENIVESDGSIGFYNDTPKSESVIPDSPEKEDTGVEFPGNYDGSYEDTSGMSDKEINTSNNVKPNLNTVDASAKKYLPQTGSHPLTIGYYVGVISLSLILIGLLITNLKEKE